MFSTTTSIPVYDWVKPTMRYILMELPVRVIPVVGMTGMDLVSCLAADLHRQRARTARRRL
jgi:hypothetical protein